MTNINQAISVSTQLTFLKKGVYILRYIEVKSKQPIDLPNVPLEVHQAPIDLPGKIELTTPDGQKPGVLSAPDHYLIVNVLSGDAVLSISKYLPKHLAAIIDVAWRLESLSHNGIASTKKDAEQQQVFPIQLKGHIERVGDKTVPKGEWLGDPLGKARLEAIVFKWPPLSGLSIEATCISAGRYLQAKEGEWLGVRQQAAPITELTFTLKGDQADSYLLSGEAAFSDNKIIPITNSGRLTSTSNSYLVALRLSIIRKQQQFNTNIATANKSTQAYSVWTDPDKTLLYK